MFRTRLLRQRFLQTFYWINCAKKNRHMKNLVELNKSMVYPLNALKSLVPSFIECKNIL